MLCMVGSGNGASKRAEMLFGHVWGGPVVGTTRGDPATSQNNIIIKRTSGTAAGLGRHLGIFHSTVRQGVWGK